MHENYELFALYDPLQIFGHLTELRIAALARRPGHASFTRGPKIVADVGFEQCPHLDLVLLTGDTAPIRRLDNEATIRFSPDRFL